MTLFSFQNINVNVGELQIKEIWLHDFSTLQGWVLMPSLQIGDNYKEDVTLVTGSVVNSVFVEHSLTFYYVTIQKIFIHVHERVVNVKCMFEIRDKSNKYVRKEIDWEVGTQIKQSVNGLVGIINTLNRYIENGSDLERIIWNRLVKTSYLIYPKFVLKDKTHKFIMDIVDKLKIKSYSNGSSRVGRDNVTWNETYISNLPDDEYWCLKLYNSISDFFPNIDKINWWNGDTIHVVSDRDSFWGAVDTKESEIFDLFTDDLKQIIKIDLALKFSKQDWDSYLLSQLQKTVY